MLALYIILGIIALFCLFLCLRAKLFVIWAGELFLKIGLGFISFEIPLSKYIKKDEGQEKTTEAPPKKKKEKKEKKSKKEKKPKEKQPFSKQLEFFKDLALAAFNRFGKKIRVEKYVLKVSVGLPDAAQTAMLYGALSGLMANLTQIILNYRHKKGARIYSECKPDFLSESMDIYVDIGASIMLWNVVITGISAAWIWVKYKLKTRQKKTKKTMNEER